MSQRQLHQRHGIHHNDAVDLRGRVPGGEQSGRRERRRSVAVPRPTAAVLHLPVELYVGRCHVVVSDRGRRPRGAPRGVGLGHVLPAARDDTGPHGRIRGLRSLPPRRTGHRPHVVVGHQGV